MTDAEKWKALAAELLDRLNKRESAEHARNMIAAALAEAAADENEQCAKIAEDWYLLGLAIVPPATKDACVLIAENIRAIRAREQKP